MFNTVRWSVAACMVMAAGCSWLTGGSGGATPDEPAPSPPAVERPSPGALALLEKGRSLFDKGQYELAGTAFEAAASDYVAATEAKAFLARINVLLGQAPADSWQIDPMRAGEPAMAACIAVEVRLLLNEARRLLAEGRTKEATSRLERAQALIDSIPLIGTR